MPKQTYINFFNIIREKSSEANSDTKELLRKIETYVLENDDSIELSIYLESLHKMDEEEMK